MPVVLNKLGGVCIPFQFATVETPAFRPRYSTSHRPEGHGFNPSKVLEQYFDGKEYPFGEWPKP